MSVLNQSGEEQVECPLCMEPLEVDDLNFFPCTCGYQICRFCWHRIRTDENGLCPACRKAYPENPADFKPLSQEEVAKLKAEKRHKDQQRKQKITENRKHLANVRVVQRNLVFVVGLPMRLADSEVLKKHEYFGKFGKIHKVVINQSTSYAGSQGPSASAYVTYQKADDALRAIQAVNNILVDGRTVKTSLGTTKYCSHFMKNQTCPKPDCMYLHDLGDIEASFTKEEMQQGKHQEYERKLHEQLLNSYNQSNKDRKPTSSPPSVTLSSMNCHAINSSSGCNGANTTPNLMQTNHSYGKEAWPSLQPGIPSSGSSSASSISSNSSVSSNSNGNGYGNNGNNGNGNGNSSTNTHHGNSKGENSRRQKFEHSSKTTGQNNKKRHGAEDHRGKAKDKLHNPTTEDHPNKTVHSKTNHNARVNTKVVKEVANDQKVSVVKRCQNQATAVSDTNNSVDNQMERVGIRVDSEIRDGENGVNVASGTVSNDTSARGSTTGGRALSTSHRAATLFEPDNNSFFSSNSFPKVSTSAAGSAGPEWPLSSLTLTHMPDVLPPVHSSEDWQAAFGFSDSSTAGLFSKGDGQSPSKVVPKKSPTIGKDVKETSVSKDGESCDSVSFESQNDQQISVQGFNCHSSHSSSTENVSLNIVPTSTEDFRLSDVGQLNQKLNEFALEEGSGTVSTSVENGGSGSVTVSETNSDSISMHSTANCENHSAVQCSQSPVYSTLPSTFVQDPTIFMVNRHPILPSGTHMIPNGIQPIQAAKFLSEFHLRQSQVQTSQQLPVQMHGHAVLENTNYNRHLIEGSIGSKFSVINMNAFGGNGDSVNVLTLSKSTGEIPKLQNGSDEIICRDEDTGHLLENGKYSNYENIEGQKNCESSSDEYIEYNSESENSVQEHNEELPGKENQRVTDDELGFDPFHETQKALAEMMEKENLLVPQGQQNHVPHPSQHINHLNQLHQQYQHMNHLNHHPTHFGQTTVFGTSKVLSGFSTPIASHHLLSQQIATNHRLQGNVTNVTNVGSCTKLVDGLALGSTNVPPRARLPPPGFTSAPNHMNAFGLGIPRAPTNTGSKILPFMGLGNSSNSSNNGTSSPISQLNTLSSNMSLTANLSSQPNMTPPLLFPRSNNHSSTPNQTNVFVSQNNSITHNSVTKSCSENFNTKEWPDNLRSLIPSGNGISQSPVSVAFSGSNSPTPPPAPNNQNATFSSVQSSTLKSWSGAGPCSDWTALDPAIMSSRPHNYLNSNSVAPPQHPIILCNSSTVLNQANPNTQYLHLPSTAHWLRSLASDNFLYGTNMNQTLSSSDWNVQTHATVNSIAPPPPGFALRMAASQQPTVQNKLIVSSPPEMAKIENI